jgi:hypothetical protein
MVDEVDKKELDKAIQRQSGNIAVRSNCLRCYAFAVSKKAENVCKLEFKQRVIPFFVLGHQFDVPVPMSNCPKPKSRYFFNKCKTANII